MTPTPAHGPSVTPIPTTVAIVPLIDATLWENQGDVANGSGIHLFVGNNGAGVARRAVLKFDVAGRVPHGAQVTEVSLQLAQTKTGGAAGGTTMELYRVLSSWGEGTSNAGDTRDGGGTAAKADDATWTFRFTGGESWTSAGGDFGPNPSGLTNSVIWDSSDGLVAEVQSWLDEPESNFGWIIIGDETWSGTARQFGSSESVNPPRLLVTYQ